MPGVTAATAAGTDVIGFGRRPWRRTRRGGRVLPVASPGPSGTAAHPVADADYPRPRVKKIYVGRSRHWVVVWLWFFS